MAATEDRGVEMLLSAEETRNGVVPSSNPKMALNARPSIWKTCLTLTLLLIPMIMGMKITLFSRDVHVRQYYTDAFMGGDKIPDIIWGLSCATFPLGGGIGALTIELLSKRIGKKFSVLLLTLLGISGQILLFLSYYFQTYILLVISRFVDGYAIGSKMNVGICYFVELLHHRYTSTFTPMVQLFINIGLSITVLFSLDSIINKNWILASIPVSFVQCLLAIFLLFLPESPRYVYQRTKNREMVRDTLRQLRGKEYKDLEEELKNIIDEENSNAQITSISTLSFLSNKTMAASIFVMSMIQIFQQISGINAVVYCANDFISKAKFAQDDLGTFVVISFCFVGSIVFTPFLARVSGKKMLLFGYIGMTVSLVISFIFWKMKLPPLATIIGLGCYLFVFQAGPGPKPWTIILETYLPQHHVAAQGFFTFLNWGFTVIVVVVFMLVAKTLDFYVSIVLAVICLLISIFLWFFMVDPSGKSHQEIMAEYRRKFAFFG